MPAIRYRLKKRGRGIGEVSLFRASTATAEELCAFPRAEWLNVFPWQPRRTNLMRLRDGYVEGPGLPCYRCLRPSQADPGECDLANVQISNALALDLTGITMVTGQTGWDQGWQYVIDHCPNPPAAIPTPILSIARCFPGGVGGVYPWCLPSVIQAGCDEICESLVCDDPIPISFVIDTPQCEDLFWDAETCANLGGKSFAAVFADLIAGADVVLRNRDVETPACNCWSHWHSVDYLIGPVCRGQPLDSVRLGTAICVVPNPADDAVAGEYVFRLRVLLQIDMGPTVLTGVFGAFPALELNATYLSEPFDPLVDAVPTEIVLTRSLCDGATWAIGNGMGFGQRFPAMGSYVFYFVDVPEQVTATQL
jgi:hypothetical protein